MEIECRWRVSPLSFWYSEDFSYLEILSEKRAKLDGTQIKIFSVAHTQPSTGLSQKHDGPTSPIASTPRITRNELLQTLLFYPFFEIMNNMSSCDKPALTFHFDQET
jgi:hypothetical protein